MPFIYRPLDPGTGHDRYVSLAPDNQGGPVSLVLIHAPLQVRESSSTAPTSNDRRSDELDSSPLEPDLVMRERDDQAPSIRHTSTPPHTASVLVSQCGPNTSSSPPPFTGTYSALSYCWGDRSTKYDILLRYVDDPGPGAIFAISENLHSFLKIYGQRSGQKNETEWLWIDQLCIDQSNDPEKHGEISMMGDIYSQATLVIVWLGPAFAHSDQLMKVLKSGIGVSFMRLLAHHAHSRSQMFKLARRELKRSALDTLGPCIEALKILRVLPYWSRVWVCQEFLLAEEGVIYLGDSSLPINTFCRQLRYLEDVRVFNPLKAREWSECKRLIMARLFYKKDTWNGRSLLELMEGRVCERYEDKIYGIFGLLKKSTSLRSPVSMPAFSESREQFLGNIIRQLMVEYLDDANPRSEELMLYVAGHNALIARRLLQLESELGKIAVLEMVSVFYELMEGRTVSTGTSFRWRVLTRALVAHVLLAPLERFLGEPVSFFGQMLHDAA